MSKIIVEKEDDKIVLKTSAKGVAEVAVIIKNPDNEENIFLPHGSKDLNFSSYVSVDIPERYVQRDKNYFFVEYVPSMKGEHRALFIIKNKITKQVEHKFVL
jgi:hypothetical protein